MKKIYQSNALSRMNTSKIWNENFISSACLSDKTFTIVQTNEYEYCYYRKKMNIFSFGRFSLSLPFTIIAPPISIESKGFTGDIQTILRDLREKNSMHLFLNLDYDDVQDLGVPVGQTLASMVFENRFDLFDDYLLNLRSSHRRRVLIAEKKAQALVWRKIKRYEFDEVLYNLYLNVWKKSLYPLEKLEMTYFQSLEAEIYVLYEKDIPLSFIQIKIENRDSNPCLFFLFGGIDYTKNIKYDLYNNMLLKILKNGIDQKVHSVNLGQTSEYSKGFLGAIPHKRYMVFYCKYKFINFLLSKLVSFIEYKYPIKSFNVFRKNENKKL